MDITPQLKKGILAGILVIIAGGGAFVYFDPLGLNLLGLKAPPPVVQPVVRPHAVVPAAHPPAAASIAASAPVQAVAPAASSPVVAPVSAPAQALQSSPKLDEPSKTATKPALAGQVASKPATSKPATGKPERARDLDLRHCLELENDAAIAKCAGE
jgi:hypothetical protein